MLISDSLTELEAAATSLQEALADWGWAVNKDNVQGPGFSVKFLGVVWSGKTKVIPEVVIDKIQAFSKPETVKQLQTYLRLLGFWRVFIPHLASLMRPLH